MNTQDVNRCESLEEVRTLLFEIYNITNNAAINRKLDEADLRIFNVLLESGWSPVTHGQKVR